MTFVFFILPAFFLPTFCSLRCTDGPNCHFNLTFDQKAPIDRASLQNCSANEAVFCVAFLQIDYRERQVYLAFQRRSAQSRPLNASASLLANNSRAAVIQRNTVQLGEKDVRLEIILECQMKDHCIEDLLRQFWPRFVAVDNRRRTLRALRALLYSVNADPLHCVDGRVNRTVHCEEENSTCWASSPTHRYCTHDPIGFIYSYNKVYAPHELQNEDVVYTLACSANNCNSRKAIHRVRARMAIVFNRLSSSSVS